MTWLAVYTLNFSLTLPDPHMPPPQFHQGIFVQTEPDAADEFDNFQPGAGQIMHMTGSVSGPNGMEYARRPSAGLGSNNVVGHELLGYIEDGHLEDLNILLKALPAPPRQKAPNLNRMGAYEPFKIDHERNMVFHTKEELDNLTFEPKLMKCRWWIKEHAVPALWASGLVKKQIPAGGRVL